MKAHLINHPLRTINLMVDETKAITQMETEALDKYQQLHTELLELKNKFSECHSELTGIEEISKSLHENFTSLETEVKKYRSLAGYSKEEMADFPPLKPEGETLDPHQLQVIIDNQSTLTDTFNERKKELEELFEATDERLQKFDEDFDAFLDNHFSPVLTNYDNVQLDTSSFDEDVEEFRETYNSIWELRDNYVDRWDAMATGTEQYEKALKELNPRIRKISDSTNNDPLRDLEFGLN